MCVCVFLPVSDAPTVARARVYVCVTVRAGDCLSPVAEEVEEGVVVVVFSALVPSAAVAAAVELSNPLLFPPLPPFPPPHRALLCRDLAVVA